MPRSPGLRARRSAVPVALTTTLAAAVAGLVAAPASAAPPEPVVHYVVDADDVATQVLTDSSGHGLDGAITGAVSTLDLGDDALALDLAGGTGGGYVTLPRGVLEGASDLTVSTRLRWDGQGGPWQWAYALGTDVSRYLFTTPSNGDGRLRTAVTGDYAGAEAQVTGYAPLTAADWVTLTVTLDTSADRLTTYLDGVAVASAPTRVSAGQLLTAGAAGAGFLGRSFYPDPAFDGAIDDVRVYHAALTAEQVRELDGATAPEPTGITQDSFDIRTTVGVAPALPATVRGTFTDGYDRDVPVTWDRIDPSAYTTRGTFTVDGAAAGRAVSAAVTVIREGELRIDLGTDTGAFHGGASGTLYGLYGPGLPTQNLIEGMYLRTVSTKAQDGPQHPGADALEVVQPLADATGGDVYVYMTDIHRGFPYQWPGSTPDEKLGLFEEKIAAQVEQVTRLPEQYQDHVVLVPFNEPEGNMFGTGEWSYDGVSWLTDPTDYFRAWDEVYALIKGIKPDARIAGPNTSVLFSQVRGFLEHTVEAGTVPDVITWHELSHPQAIRDSVATYRTWEREVFAGTSHEGVELPVNINEYAFNYHTSVPGQMIQWVSAIEESKVDADIAYWNIDGNLSDSAVQANRGNGQWWLYNAYGQMSGHTVEVTPPAPGRNYSLQGVATLDVDKRQTRALIGGAAGKSLVVFDDVPTDVLGTSVHAWVREIAWTGQIGDSDRPAVVAERTLEVVDGEVALDFGGDLPALTESSAYEIVLTPEGDGSLTATPPTLWSGSYEAEDAAHSGTGWSRNGPEGSPQRVDLFYTSGRFDVGGLRSGSDVVLDFTVDVPQDGEYDLSVFAGSLNTFSLVQEQGPTNVFVRVDGADEQELHLPLGYKWVVWDHADTTVHLSAGTHTLSLAARSLDGVRATTGDAIVDRITLALADPDAPDVYEAELADLDGAEPVYDVRARRTAVSGSGGVELGRGDVATFWVYAEGDAERSLEVHTLGGGRATLRVNGTPVAEVGERPVQVPVSLSGGVNKVTLTGMSRTSVVDRLVVRASEGHLGEETYEAEAATLTGDATVRALSLASGGAAVDGIGGDPGNTTALTFDVRVPRAGTYAVRVRYSNPEQSPASHYNPDPLARRADVSVNGGAAQQVLFPHTFHANSFWELTVPLELERGANTIALSSRELPDFDGQTYASDTWPEFPLRSRFAPVVDSVTVARFSGRVQTIS